MMIRLGLQLDNYVVVAVRLCVTPGPTPEEDQPGGSEPLDYGTDNPVENRVRNGNRSW